MGIISSVPTPRVHSRHFLKCHLLLVGTDEVKMPQVGCTNPNHLLETITLVTRHKVLLQKDFYFLIRLIMLLSDFNVLYRGLATC